MTVTQPGHPRYLEKAQVIRVCKGSDPDLIVRFPDGRHSPIFASFTDYFANLPPQIEKQTTLTPTSADQPQLPRLELKGLLRLVRFLQQHPTPPAALPPSQLNFPLATGPNQPCEGMIEVGSLVNPTEDANPLALVSATAPAEFSSSQRQR